MKKLGFVLFAACLLASCTPSANDGKLQTYTEKFGYAKALALAKKENKRLFIDFSATWCLPCREFKKALHDPRVVEALRDYVVLLIDTDREPALKQQFDVDGIPAFFVVDGDGKKLNSKEGYGGVDDFLAWLQRGRGRG